MGIFPLRDVFITNPPFEITVDATDTVTVAELVQLVISAITADARDQFGLLIQLNEIFFPTLARG